MTTPIALFIFICGCISALLYSIDFLYFLFSGKRFMRGPINGIFEFVSIILSPLVYLMNFDFGKGNNCCGDSALFSPIHRYSIYLLILICIFSFYYSKLRDKLAPPLAEVFINCALFTGIVLNIFTAIQINEGVLWMLGNLPIMILFFYRLVDNQNLFLSSIYGNEDQKPSRLERITRWILKLDIPVQMPILLLLSVPVLVIISAIFMLFGQKPDTMIRAFTDTYKHGFSQLNHQCDDVVCPGHYLCTIAAKGHKKIVNPIRLGVRGDKQIVCNRQLLISNAFEELLERRVPGLHKNVRKLYNHVGSFVHRYYGVFNYKLISDLIYILMKPLEWFFLFCLYLTDQKPENRIAKQYLKSEHREKIDLIVRG